VHPEQLPRSTLESVFSAGWDQGWYERFGFKILNNKSFVPRSRKSVFFRDGLPVRWLGTSCAPVTSPCHHADHVGAWHADVHQHRASQV
jgi:hypothetical protein